MPAEITPIETSMRIVEKAAPEGVKASTTVNSELPAAEITESTAIAMRARFDPLRRKNARAIHRTGGSNRAGLKGAPFKVTSMSGVATEIALKRK